MEVHVERFGYDNLLQVFRFMRWMFDEIAGENIHRYFNNTFHEFKVLKKVIITETFNVNFHNKFIKFGLFCFFRFSSYFIGFNFLVYFHIYIYIYMCVCVCVCVCLVGWFLCLMAYQLRGLFNAKGIRIENSSGGNI